MAELEDRPRARAVTGWRYWQLEAGGASLHLRSLSQRGFVWQPERPLVARCANGDKRGGDVAGDEHGHRAPGIDCGCGIHASADLASLQAQALCLRPVPLVVGEVSLWGRVITEERADRRGEDHRGQFAYPRRLSVVGETLVGMEAKEAVEGLSAYGVAVEVTSREQAVGELSQTIMGFLAMSQRS